MWLTARGCSVVLTTRKTPRSFKPGRPHQDDDRVALNGNFSSLRPDSDGRLGQLGLQHLERFDHGRPTGEFVRPSQQRARDGTSQVRLPPRIVGKGVEDAEGGRPQAEGELDGRVRFSLCEGQRLTQKRLQLGFSIGFGLEPGEESNTYHDASLSGTPEQRTSTYPGTGSCPCTGDRRRDAGSVNGARRPPHGSREHAC